MIRCQNRRARLFHPFAGIYAPNSRCQITPIFLDIFSQNSQRNIRLFRAVENWYGIRNLMSFSDKEVTLYIKVACVKTIIFYFRFFECSHMNPYSCQSIRSLDNKVFYMCLCLFKSSFFLLIKKKIHKVNQTRIYHNNESKSECTYKISRRRWRK